MAQLSAVSVPASHRNDEAEQSQLPSDSEDEAGLDQNPTVNWTVLQTGHTAQQHSRTEMTMGTAISKEVPISELKDKSRHRPGTLFQALQDGSGQISAEAAVGMINHLARRKRITLPESSPQSLGKRKLLLAGDNPVSSKRTSRERSHPEKSAGDTTLREQEKRGDGRLKRPSRASIGQSSNNRSTKSFSDNFAVPNMSPVNNTQFSKSDAIDKGQRGMHTGKMTKRPSSSVLNIGSGAERAKSITTDIAVDHPSDPSLGSLPKPKRRTRERPQSPRSVRYNLRNLGRGNADETRDCSKPVEHNPNARSSVSSSEPMVTSTKKTRNVGIKSGAPATLEPLREDEAQIAERSADEESDSLDGNRKSSDNGQGTGGDPRAQLDRNEHAVESEGYDYDDDRTEDESVDERGERVDIEAEDDINCTDQTEVDRQQQVRSITGFLLRGPDWDKVLEGANTVGVSKVKNVITKGKPQLETKTIKALIEQVRKISRIYKASGRTGEVAPEVQKLERQVNLIDESKAGKQKCEMIQDIYTHAIPRMVFMLDRALDAREADCSLPDHVKGLAEIIWLQDVVISLCEKARAWTADPDTDRPIKKSTIQKIFPRLRSQRKTLSKELQGRKREILCKKDEAAAELERKHREEEMRRKDMEDEMERLAIWDKISDQLDRNERNVFRRKHSRSLSAIPALGIDHWTEEQDLVLNKYLEEYGELPASDRYLQLLTLEALQEKLPEHIRRRALYSRPNLVDFYDKTQGWVPDWVLSIQ